MTIQRAELCVAVMVLVMTLTSCGKPGKTGSAASNEDYPDSLAALNEWYEEPPADQDAAVYYERALALGRTAFVTSESLFEKAPESGQPLGTSIKETIEQFLAVQGTLIDTLNEAGKRTRARYTLDLSKGIEAEVPHLARIRAITKFHALSALVNAEADKSADATQAVVLSLHASESLADEPLIITQLVRVACQTITTMTLSDVLTRSTLTDAQLQQLERAFAEAEQRDTYYRALVGESVVCHAAGTKGPEALLNLVQELGGQSSDLTPEIRAAYENGSALEGDVEYFDKALQEIIDAARAPVALRFSEGERIEAKYENVPSSHVMSKLLLPSLARSIEANIRGVTFLRAARAALATERYRLQKHALPASLQDLVPTFLPEVPEDPYTNQPLRYVKLSEGYTIYGLGANRKDDGGIPPQDAKEHNLESKDVDQGIRVTR